MAEQEGPEHPRAVFVVGDNKVRHYGRSRYEGGFQVSCFWWEAQRWQVPRVYDLPVCGRCARIFPRER